jgi:hypothetical protein
MGATMTDNPYDCLIDHLRLLREGADLSQVPLAGNWAGDH